MEPTNIMPGKRFSLIQNSCCWGATDLKKGCYIVALVNIMFCLMFIITTPVTLTQNYTHYKLYLILRAIVSMVGILIDLLLVCAISNNIRYLLLVWVVGIILLQIGGTILVVFDAIYAHDHNYQIGEPLLQCFIIVINIYPILIVISYYKYLRHLHLSNEIPNGVSTNQPPAHNPKNILK